MKKNLLHILTYNTMVTIPTLLFKLSLLVALRCVFRHLVTPTLGLVLRDDSAWSMIMTYCNQPEHCRWKVIRKIPKNLTRLDLTKP